MAAVSCPAPFSRRASAIFRRKADTPGCIRQAIDFSGLRARAPESQDAHSQALGRFGCARHKLEKRSRALRSRGSPHLAQGPGSTAMPCRCLQLQKALAGALRREPTPIAAAHHCQKINRVGSNRRELARR